jgi:hypothetical protein
VREFRIHLAEGLDPRLAEALWRLDDARRRTLDLLRDVDDQQVNAPPLLGRNTIGTLLYHVAAIELDWLYADILEEPFPKGADAWFPVDVRTAAGDLSRVREPLATHLERMTWVRALLETRVAALDPMVLDELHENQAISTTPACGPA